MSAWTVRHWRRFIVGFAAGLGACHSPTAPPAPPTICRAPDHVAVLRRR